MWEGLTEYELALGRVELRLLRGYTEKKTKNMSLKGAHQSGLGLHAEGSAQMLLPVRS